MRMMKEKKIFRQLTSENICQIYELLHKEGFVAFGLHKNSAGILESLISNINGINFGIENYPSTELKLVAYLYFLVKNHPFVDGNKRTATLTFVVLCSLNGRKPRLTDFSLDELVVTIEQIQEDDHQKVIAELTKLLF